MNIVTLQKSPKIQRDSFCIIIWMFPKIMVGPQIIHLFIGFSIIFTIHFKGYLVPLFLVQHPYNPALDVSYLKIFSIRPWQSPQHWTWARFVGAAKNQGGWEGHRRLPGVSNSDRWEYIYIYIGYREQLTLRTYF